VVFLRVQGSFCNIRAGTEDATKARMTLVINWAAAAEEATDLDKKL